MEYVYDLFDKNDVRIETTTSLGSIGTMLFLQGGYVVANSGNIKVTLKTVDDFDGFKEARERSIWIRTKPKMKAPPQDTVKKDAINPSHYQTLFDVPYSGEYQWLEHLQYHKHYRDNPEGFKLAVEMQVRKYLDRCGNKDAEGQELMKALWYLKFLAAFVKNGNKPIFVKDIEVILAQPAS